MPSVWDRVFSVRTAAGFKDNVLLGSVAPQQSAFISTGIEASISRLPINGPQISLFASFDDIRYLSTKEVEKEQIGLAQAQWKPRMSRGWQPSVSLQYFYVDQVLDLSTTEAELDPLPVRGHSISLRPALRRDLGAKWWTELELAATRQFFEEPLDDYWEPAPKLTLGRSYGNKSEAGLTYTHSLVLYDDRPKPDTTGLPEPGTLLRYQRLATQLFWRHNWGQSGRWRTTTRLTYTRNEDNGGGYYDYDRYQISEQLRFTAAGWELRGQVRFSHYEYDRQSGDSLSTRRRRDDVALGLRGEKQVVKFLKLFADYEREWTASTLSSEEYSVNTFSGGLLWEF